MMTPAAGKLASFMLGVLLIALLFGLPTFVGAVLLLKLFHSAAIVTESQGIVGFVVITSLFAGLMAGWLGLASVRVERRGDLASALADALA